MPAVAAPACGTCGTAYYAPAPDLPELWLQFVRLNACGSGSCGCSTCGSRSCGYAPACSSRRMCKRDLRQHCTDWCTSLSTRGDDRTGSDGMRRRRAWLRLPWRRSHRRPIWLLRWPRIRRRFRRRLPLVQWPRQPQQSRHSAGPDLFAGAVDRDVLDAGDAGAGRELSARSTDDPTARHADSGAAVERNQSGGRCTVDAGPAPSTPHSAATNPPTAQPPATPQATQPNGTKTFESPSPSTQPPSAQPPIPDNRGPGLRRSPLVHRGNPNSRTAYTMPSRRPAATHFATPWPIAKTTAVMPVVPNVDDADGWQSVR